MMWWCDGIYSHKTHRKEKGLKSWKCRNTCLIPLGRGSCRVDTQQGGDDEGKECGGMDLIRSPRGGRIGSNRCRSRLGCQWSERKALGNVPAWCRPWPCRHPEDKNYFHSHCINAFISVAYFTWMIILFIIPKAGFIFVCLFFGQKGKCSPFLELTPILWKMSWQVTNIQSRLV